MIKQNMHIHSKYSWDSDMDLEEIVNYLIDNGIEHAGICDHVEFGWQNIDNVINGFNIRNFEIDYLNRKYFDKIKLYKGCEVSEPHLYKNEMMMLKDLDLDYIMGSIHKIDKLGDSPLEIKKAVKKYYEDILEMVNNSDIDVVGHLDYIKRYYDSIWKYTDLKQVSKILKTINEKNMIIEVNTSGLRRGCDNFFPSLDKICVYKLKSPYVMFGTDAHRLYELDDNLFNGGILADVVGLEQVVFEKRKMKKI